MYRSKIKSVGHYVPERVVTNDELSKLMDTSDEWINERTGIKERRFADIAHGETPSVMGTRAALVALERAAMDKHEIDFIIDDIGFLQYHV